MPDEIFYPEEEPQPENPYGWVRGLIALKPLPSAKLAKELGFNVFCPFAGIPSGWDGKIAYTSTTIRINATKVIGYWPSDEPDCHKHDPYDALKRVREMKKLTRLPVGFAPVSDIGCGTTRSSYTKEEYKQAWIEVINQTDWVRFTTYPYRKPGHDKWGNPMETMEFFHKFWQEHITIPIIPVIQAHTHEKLYKPNPLEQVKFWVDRGYGYIVYPWDDGHKPIRGVVDMQDEWREALKYRKEV